MRRMLILLSVLIFFVFASRYGYASMEGVGGVSGFEGIEGIKIEGNVTIVIEPENKVDGNPFEGKTAPMEGYVPPGFGNEPDLADVSQVKAKPSLDYSGVASGNEIDENPDEGYVVNKNKKILDVPKKVVAGGEKRAERADNSVEAGNEINAINELNAVNENDKVNEDEGNKNGKVENNQGFFSAIANWFNRDSNGNFEDSEKSDLKEGVNDNGKKIEIAEFDGKRVNEENREIIGKEKESADEKSNLDKKIEIEGKESDTGGKKQDSFLAGLVKWLKG